MYIRRDEMDFDTFYQGDVIKDFPFFIFKDDNLGEDIVNKSKKININSKLSEVVILSQTCDIQERKNVIIAPVYKIETFEKAGILDNGKAGQIRKRKINYWFYMPKLEGVFEESLIDFQTIYYIPKSLLEKYKNNKILTMTDWGRHHLGWALGVYFGRPIEDKTKKK